MKNGMLLKVFIAIVLAILAGLFTHPQSDWVRIYGLIGQLFLNALSLVVVPLVSASIITGMAKMGRDQSFGSLGLKTFGYFILTSLMAILVGLFLAVIIAPGGLHESVATLSVDSSRWAEITKQSQGDLFSKVEQILLKLVPANIVAAASQGQMLGLILFCMLFGFFISKLDVETSSVLLNFWRGIFQVMMKITLLVMKALPIGVFGLVAKALSTAGLETIGSVASFFGTVLLGLFIYGFILLPLLLRFVAKINPWTHFKAMYPALVTAFSTSSSAATLPITLECVEKQVGVSNRISSFVLPLGTSVNLSGSALYVCVGVLFVAQSFGLSLQAPSLVVVVLMTLLTSLGTAGIPSASMISIVVILHTLGLPADGIGLIMAIERILDMFRTVFNVFGTSCCAVLVAKSEGEKNLALAPLATPVTDGQG